MLQGPGPPPTRPALIIERLAANSTASVRSTRDEDEPNEDQVPIGSPEEPPEGSSLVRFVQTFAYGCATSGCISATIGV